MATVAATGQVLNGSLEGAVVGSFTVPQPRASGDIITVADAGIGANSLVFLSAQGNGGGGVTGSDFAVTAITPGIGFQVTYQGTAATSANIPFWYLRTA